MTKTEISCSDCQATCCGKGQTMTLSDPEVAFLKFSGTLLNQKGIAKPYRNWYRWVDTQFEPEIRMIVQAFGNYNLSNRCGYVIEEGGLFRCGVHEDNRRPEICRDFEVGGEGCLYIREFGLPNKKTTLERIQRILHILK